MSLSSDEFLGRQGINVVAHHGVKGMRWGVRKDRVGRSNNSAVVTQLTILAVIAAASAAHTKYQLNKDSGKREARESAGKPFKKDPSLSKKMTVDQIQKNIVSKINPGFGEPGTMMNCRRCTLTYEMRRRGYDVTATKSLYATGQTLKGLKTATSSKSDKFKSLYGEETVIGKNKMLKLPSAAKKSEAIFDSLSQYPDGARGELGVRWGVGGHSMAFEIIKGKPVIFDTQNAQVYADAKSFNKISGTISDAGHTRLDNKTLNEDFMRRWATNA